MADTERAAQSFANHVQNPVVWVAAGLVLVIDVVVRLVHLVRDPGLGSAWAVVAGMAMLVVWGLLRRYALRLQDRIIRLEMRVRLDQVLPPERRGDIARLGLGPLIALRFAGDAELPALVTEVLASDLHSRSAIKQKVKDWQADEMRV